MEVCVDVLPIQILKTFNQIMYLKYVQICTSQLCFILQLHCALYKHYEQCYQYFNNIITHLIQELIKLT